MEAPALEMRTPTPVDLARRVGLWGATAIVIGNVIGSGIFTAPREVAGALPIPQFALLAWALGGALSLAGAFVYAELGTTYPRTGGSYVYLRRAFGERMAFVFGWAELCVVKPTGAAGVAVILAQYATELVPAVPERVFAVLVLIIVYGMNYRSVAASSGAQLLLTIFKMLGLIALAAFALARLGVHLQPAVAPALSWQSTWGAALIPILWTYDGWSDVAYVAGEVRRPERTLPASLLLGTAVVTGLYLVVNWAVLAAFNADELQGDPAVLSTLARRVWGDAGSAGVTALVFVSTFGSLLAGAITTPRIFYAMGRDGLFFRWAGLVHPRFGTPWTSILTICTTAIVFVLTGTFDQIITYFVFVMWLFYALTGVALFRLRRMDADLPRPYRVPMYPLTPLLFVIASTGMLVSICIASRRESLIGGGLVLLGIPAYSVWRRLQSRR